MIVAPLHRHFSPGHLGHVMGRMRELGAPRLRGYHDAASGCWLLAEGTHRIRAAMLLGIAPVLVAVRWWRSRGALGRARFAAAEYGYVFPLVLVAPSPGGSESGGRGAVDLLAIPAKPSSERSAEISR